MRYVKQSCFDTFECIAGKCPDTCCAGWQIVIDEESLEMYSGVDGEFGRRLHNSVDWEEGVFFQCDKRCSFLNQENLCDLYLNLGPDSLCDTCRDYPRHTEEFEGLRELSLSLSCPVACELLLREKKIEFTEYETDEEEELAEEFEEFDLLLFTQLEDAREVIFKIIKNQDLSFEQKLAITLLMAKEMDDCIEADRFMDMEEVVHKYAEVMSNPEQLIIEIEKKLEKNGENKEEKKEEKQKDYIEFAAGNRYQLLRDNFEVFHQMEILREDWMEKKETVFEALYAKGEEEYEEILSEFTASIRQQGIGGISFAQITENLLISFVYTWFCGGVYDGYIYSKMAMAAFCTCYIMEFVMARWEMNGRSINFNECVEIVYQFTREVEHSDVNLGILEEWLRG